MSRRFPLRLGYTMLVAGLLAFPALAQQAEETPQPQVRVNYMNVCTPNAKEREQIVAGLNALLPAPKPVADYEVSRGRATGEESVAWYIRLRREFAPKSSFLTAQYSIQEDGDKMIETLVLHPRDPKTALGISLEDSASVGSAPIATLLNVNSPVTRIKIERFGSPSVGLDRCPEADQHAYEEIFRQASAVFAAYRSTLELKAMMQRDLTWLQQKAVEGKTVKKSEHKSGQ